MSLSLLSLRWRLIWSLILLQVVVGSLVLGGFIVLAWVAGRIVDETGQETIAVIQRALTRDAEGRLAVAPTPEIRRLDEADSSFWFIARDAAGSEVRHGDVPAKYAGLATTLDGMERLTIDPSKDNTQPKARFERVETDATGPVNVVAQTGVRLRCRRRVGDRRRGRAADSGRACRARCGAPGRWHSARVVAGRAHACESGRCRAA